MITIKGREICSIIKACELAKVSRRTIYNWLATNKIEYVRTAGGAVRIFIDSMIIKPKENEFRSNYVKDRKL